MKAFLYAIGTAAVFGMTVFLFFILWAASEMDAMEIICISAFAASIASIPFFLKIDDLVKKSKGERNDK